MALVAALYNQCGQNNKCEEFYGKYIYWVEKFYNKDSLETSNAYFLVGLYYFEREALNKAAACFMRSHAIRKVKLGPTH